jgi:hypothetical protein
MERSNPSTVNSSIGNTLRMAPIAANKALYNRGWQTTLREGLENVEYRQSFEINDTNERLAKFLK